MQPQSSYGPYSTLKNWKLSNFIAALARNPVVMDMSRHVDLFDVMLQATAGCRDAGPVASKTIVYKVGLYYHHFDKKQDTQSKWFMFNR